MNTCHGLGVTQWRFDYYDNPSDYNGYKWKATFCTHIWVCARCWKNTWVVNVAGEWTNGWKGNDQKISGQLRCLRRAS